MIVFAVLAALGVEEWRESLQLQAFAARARAAVDLEIGENLAEFQRAETSLVVQRDELAAALEVLTAEARGEAVDDRLRLSLDWELPEISTASWRVAQASEAAPLFDYDWIIARARHYEWLERYQVILDQMTVDLAELSGTAATRNFDELAAGIQRLYGRLVVLVQLHERLRADMANYLAAAEEAGAS